MENEEINFVTMGKGIINNILKQIENYSLHRENCFKQRKTKKKNKNNNKCTKKTKFKINNKRNNYIKDLISSDKYGQYIPKVNNFFQKRLNKEFIIKENVSQFEINERIILLSFKKANEDPNVISEFPLTKLALCLYKGKEVEVSLNSLYTAVGKNIYSNKKRIGGKRGMNIAKTNIWIKNNTTNFNPFIVK